MQTSPSLSSPASSDGLTRHDKTMAVDEMLQRHAGEFGRWQLRHFMLTSLAWALNAFHTMVVVFTDREPKWRCMNPAADCPPAMCGLKKGSWEWSGGKGASTVAEWGLVCGEKYKVGLSQSAFFAGSMVGAGIFGHLSDSFLGRKRTLTLVCAMNAAFGLLTARSPAFWAYAVLRFLTGLSCGGVGLIAFVLTTEPVGPSKRGTVGTSTFYFFCFGSIFLALIAYFHHSWRTVYLLSSLPSLFFVIAVLPFVSESPRWYLVRRRVSDAMKVIRAIAKSNNRQVPDDVSLALDCDDANKTANNEAASGSILDVIRSPVTRLRLLLVVAINLLSSVVYYGLSLNVMNLKTNLYLSVVLNAVAEMPAYALTAVALKMFGRKPMTVGTMWLSAVFCCIGSVLADEGVWKTLRMACGMVGIFAMAATYGLLFVYSAELFPTAVRNSALGCVTQGGQTGAILAPLVVVSGGRWPFTVFAGCGVVGGAMALYLPETLNKPMYDTMVGMEKGESQMDELEKAAA